MKYKKNGIREIRTHKDVSLEVKKDISNKVEAMIKKHGAKSVRLVSSNIFQKYINKENLQKEIREKEAELEKLILKDRERR